MNKDAESLLRYGLPIDSKEARDLQEAIEGVKENVRSKRLSEGKKKMSVGPRPSSPLKRRSFSKPSGPKAKPAPLNFSRKSTRNWTKFQLLSAKTPGGARSKNVLNSTWPTSNKPPPPAP